MSGSLFKKDRSFVISVVCTVVEGLLAGCNFILLYEVVKEVFGGEVDMGSLLALTGFLVVIFIARLFIYAFGYTLGQIAGARVSHRIRLYLGDKIKRIPLSSFTQRQSGDYLNVLTANVDDYEKILTHKTGDLVKDITLSVMLIGFVSWLYLPAGLILGIALLLVVPALWLSWRQVRKCGNEKSAICARNVSVIVEYVEGIQTLRAYGAGGMKNKAITDSMRAYSDISFLYEARVIPIGVVLGLLTGLSLPAVLVVCGDAWQAGQLDATTFLLIAILPLFMYKLSNSIFLNFTAYKNLMIAKRHIQAVAAEPVETGSTKPFQPEIHDIRLLDIDFAYEGDALVLHGLNLACADGKLTAIVGDSGSGKSTILNLIANYYDPQKGSVEIGGRQTAGHAPERVLEGISIVDQNVFLFNDSVMDNIRYARPDATDGEVVEACRQANADGFIQQMEHGYATFIGENGSRLSGGERQRLSIARAILRDAPILLLDEATASLDIDNELAVKEAIANLLALRKTVVMVAHTLPIVRGADSIAVIDDGRVVEQGTHDALLARGGKYASMWQAVRQHSG